MGEPIRVKIIIAIVVLVRQLNRPLKRLQLARADNTLVSPELYNRLFTIHGSTMMFLFATPMLEGIAVLVRR